LGSSEGGGGGAAALRSDRDGRMHLVKIEAAKNKTWAQMSAVAPLPHVQPYWSQISDRMAGQTSAKHS